MITTTKTEETISEEQKNIDAFISKHPGKKVVVIQGLGFVGAVMSLVCANALNEDYAVIGVDLADEANKKRIAELNSGTFPIKADDPKIETFYNKAMSKGNFLATYEPYAYALADVIIVDINLDVQKKSSNAMELESYDVDLSGFKAAAKTLGNNCKEDVLIVVETTVPPGTCQKIVKPIIDTCLAERQLSTEKWKLGHSYERVMPGPQYIDSIQNFYRVYSGIDDRSADATEVFLRTIIRTDEYPLTRLGNTNATEMAKVLENSYRAMNIAFMVEWTRFAEEADVNIYEVVNAIRMRPTHKNIMLPGIGVGGYCLTKDPLLASWAKQTLFNGDKLDQSEKGVRINDKMPISAFEFLKSFAPELRDKNILLLGVSYRQDVGDTRYTPVGPFYEQLEEEKATITLHDTHVDHWEEKNISVPVDINEVMNNNYDLIVISTGHRLYKSEGFINQLLNLDSTIIYDCIGIYSDEVINKLKTKHTVKVLGRGDL